VEELILEELEPFDLEPVAVFQALSVERQRLPSPLLHQELLWTSASQQAVFVDLDNLERFQIARYL